MVKKKRHKCHTYKKGTRRDIIEGMPKLLDPNDPKTVGAIFEKVEKGLPLTTDEQDSYDKLLEFSESVDQVFEPFSALMHFYESSGLTSFSETVKTIQDTFTFLEDQKGVALSVNNNNEFILQKGSKTIPFSAITIRDNIFHLEGKPLRGLTTGSQYGQVLLLFIEHNGSFVSDEEIIEVAKIVLPKSISNGKYEKQEIIRKIGRILNDLKRFLKKNKIKAIIERDSYRKGYDSQPLTKIIRNRKQKKNIAPKS